MLNEPEQKLIMYQWKSHGCLRWLGVREAFHVDVKDHLRFLNPSLNRLQRLEPLSLYRVQRQISILENQYLWQKTWLMKIAAA